jgi:hypothetical protein
VIVVAQRYARDDMPETDGDRLNELADLANDLLEQATEMRRQWAELAEAIGREGSLTLDPGAEAPPSGDPATDQARLVALDMMLSGRTREETDAHLRRTFSGQDFSALLDEVFSEDS